MTKRLKKVNDDIDERISGFKRGLENFKEIAENDTIDVKYEVAYKSKKY